MKKSFMFVAVAAAGMLASCSSESLTGSDPKIEPTQEELVPIEISVATPMARSGMTRGTGTVGAVEDGSGNAVNNDGTTTGTPKANIWAGQKVNVYMFEKGTLNIAKFKSGDATGIFENAEMDTPKASENTASGLAHYVDPAGSGRYLVKYYPMNKAYDFWGYRVDDATLAGAPAVNTGGDKYILGITVDGTQDVLGAKTTTPDLSGTTLTTADLYSAKAARQYIQPTLEFNHLMTRLTFEAYPGNDNAKTVYVTGVKVRALNDYDPTNASNNWYYQKDGTLEFAGTGAGFAPQIVWLVDDATNIPTPYELKKRAAGDTDGNQNLVPLTDGTTNWATNGAISMDIPGDGTGATDGSEKAPIGESIIAPDAEYYEIEIDLVQKVAKYENSAPGTPTDWEDYEFNSIKTVVKSDGLKFKPGYTYDFIFKVYGLEKITVTTVLKPWIWGENQEIPTE